MSETLVTSSNKTSNSEDDICNRIDAVERDFSNELDRSKCPFSNCKTLEDLRTRLLILESSKCVKTLDKESFSEGCPFSECRTFQDFSDKLGDYSGGELYELLRECKTLEEVILKLELLKESSDWNHVLSKMESHDLFKTCPYYGISNSTN